MKPVDVFRSNWKSGSGQSKVCEISDSVHSRNASSVVMGSKSVAEEVDAAGLCGTGTDRGVGSVLSEGVGGRLLRTFFGNVDSEGGDGERRTCRSNRVERLVSVSVESSSLDIPEFSSSSDSPDSSGAGEDLFSLKEDLLVRFHFRLGNEQRVVDSCHVTPLQMNQKVTTFRITDLCRQFRGKSAISQSHN